MTYSSETPRTGLRALEPEDLELLYDVENDPNTWSYGPAPAFYSRNTLRRYIESATGDIFADGQLRLVATLTADSTAIGLADLTSFDAFNMRAEVGLLLLPQYRGQGFAADILRQLAAHARRLHLHQLYAIVAADNAAAAATFAAAGFSNTARLTEWLHTDDGYTDAMVWQVSVEN